MPSPSLTPAKLPTQHFGGRGPSEKPESPQEQPRPKAEPPTPPPWNLPRFPQRQSSACQGCAPSRRGSPAWPWLPHTHGPRRTPAQDLGDSQPSSSPSAPEPSRSVLGECGEAAGPQAGHRPLPPARPGSMEGPGVDTGPRTPRVGPSHELRKGLSLIPAIQGPRFPGRRRQLLGPSFHPRPGRVLASQLSPGVTQATCLPPGHVSPRTCSPSKAQTGGVGAEEACPPAEEQGHLTLVSPPPRARKACH